MKEQHQDWYFTFKYQDKELRNKYMVIHGTYESARNTIIELREDSWSFQYSKDEFKGQVEQYGLTEVDR